MSPPPLVEMRAAGRRIDDRWLFRDFALEARTGECVAITGPTGAGKSALLRSLALLDRLDEGDVFWGDRKVPPSEVPRFRADVMYLHQRPALFDGTVEENLQRPFALRSHDGKAFDRSRAKEMLDALGASPSFLDKEDRDLSGGERQLVALVRALLLSPRVLLVDEPTAALDARTTEAAERQLSQWLEDSSTQRSILWVTHDAAQVGRVSSRTVTIENQPL